MEQAIKNYVSFITNSGFQPSEVKRLSDKRSAYTIIWQNTSPSVLSITNCSLQFLFDMDSFLVRYSEMFPETPVNESFVLSGIKILFKNVAAFVLATGSQGFDELAGKLHQRRGQIMLKNYGV